MLLYTRLMTEGWGKVEEGRDGEGGERRRTEQSSRLGGEREEKEEGNHPWVEWAEHRRGGEMEEMIWRGRLGRWEETTLRNEGRGKKRGGLKEIKEKSVGALHTEKMTRGARGGEGGRGHGLSFIRIFWEHGLRAAGRFIKGELAVTRSWPERTSQRLQLKVTFKWYIGEIVTEYKQCHVVVSLLRPLMPQR